MDHLLTLLIGFLIGIVLLSPFVPGLRPLVIRVLVAGLSVLAALWAALSSAGHHWREMLTEARTKREAAAEKAALEARAATEESDNVRVLRARK